MKLSELSKNSQSQEKSQEKKQDRKQQISQQYESLKNHSSDELMDMLSQEVQKQKSVGAFDYEGLRASVEKMKGYLPWQTYQNMLNVLDKLK